MSILAVLEQNNMRREREAIAFLESRGFSVARMMPAPAPVVPALAIVPPVEVPAPVAEVAPVVPEVIEAAAPVIDDISPKVRAPRLRVVAAPKLNAIGKPYGAGFDPRYRMKYKPRRYAPSTAGASTAARIRDMDGLRREIAANWS